MLLKELKNISDEEKIEQFDELLKYTEYLQDKNAEYMVWKIRFEREQKKELQRHKDKLRLEKWHELLSVRADTLVEIWEAQKKEHPILALTSARWASRKKIYPELIKNPEKPNSMIAKETKTSATAVKKARQELLASWEVLNNKIDLVKRIVTRSAMLTETAQEELLKRFKNCPESIANKDLISAIKNSSAMYSLFVGQATDSHWWTLEKQDQKLLDDVLWDNL